jgi:NADH-quinone oxidoreductase subunit I
MAVTARNFVGSYFEKDPLITLQNPEERIPLAENYRNFPFLIYNPRFEVLLFRAL